MGLREQVGARFLKKETFKKPGSGRRRQPQYTIMTEKQAREKVGHCLRDLIAAARRRTTREEEYRCELNTSSISSIEEEEKENPKQVRERGVYIYVPILPKCYCHLKNFYFFTSHFNRAYKVLTDNPTEDHSRFVAAISPTV